jgi:hypothetical protein
MKFCPSHKEKKREICPFEKDRTASHECGAVVLARSILGE